MFVSWATMPAILDQPMSPNMLWKGFQWVVSAETQKTSIRTRWKGACLVKIDPKADVNCAFPCIKQEQKIAFFSPVSWVHGFGKERSFLGKMEEEGRLLFSLLFVWLVVLFWKWLPAKDQMVISISWVILGAKARLEFPGVWTLPHQVLGPVCHPPSHCLS